MRVEKDKNRFTIFIYFAITVFVVMLIGNLYTGSVVKELSQSNSSSSGVTGNITEAIVTIFANAFVGLVGVVMGGFGLFNKRMKSVLNSLENELYRTISCIVLLLLLIYGAYNTLSPFIRYSNLINNAVPELFYITF